MNSQDIYHKMMGIADGHHVYIDSFIAIAKWVEADFDYNPQKNEAIKKNEHKF